MSTGDDEAEPPPLDLVESVKFGDRARNEVAERVVFQLEQECNEQVIMLASEFLQDERPEIRAAALGLVTDSAACWPLEREAAEPLLTSLRDRSSRVRRAALRLARRTIGTRGCEAFVEDLIHCLADRHADIRQEAIEILVAEVGGNMQPSCHYLLAEYLGHRSASTRSAAREVLLSEGQDELVGRFDPTKPESVVVDL